MRHLLYLILVSCLLFSACEDSGKSKDDKDGKDTIESDTRDNNNSQSKGKINSAEVFNDIQLQANGLNVDRAILAYDSGELIPSDNRVPLGEQINLQLNISGWQVKNGKVFLGASERITTSEGDIILDEKDLFHEYADGVDPGDANFITLNAVITKSEVKYDHFLVSFRVWDKTSKGEITGSYKFSIQ